MQVNGISADQIAEWLVERIATELKLAPEAIALDESFFNIGLNSLTTLIISGQLGEFLGVEDFDPSTFWDYPTIAKLASHLAPAAAAA